MGKGSHWLTVLGNLAVVGGLVLVMLQLRQNSELLKTQLLYLESERLMNIEMSVIGERGAEVWAKSIEDPKALTLEELRIIEAVLWSFVEQLRATRNLGELGLLDDAEWRARVRSDAGFYLANPYARTWWNNFSNSNESLQPDLIDAVNERLDRLPANFTGEYFENIRNALGN